ncbi:MAG: hypothetical protein ACQKBU_08190, partial [Verrucomicrobiales bacterium]
MLKPNLSQTPSIGLGCGCTLLAAESPRTLFIRLALTISVSCVSASAQLVEEPLSSAPETLYGPVLPENTGEAIGGALLNGQEEPEVSE